MAQTVSLEDVVTSAFDSVLQGVWTAVVGRVERYDAARQTVDIQVTVKNRYVGEDGEIAIEVLPVINNAPVAFLGGGKFRTTYPIEAGDTCLVICLSRSIHQWLLLGDIADPGDANRHKLTDAVALVGVRDFKHSLADVPTDRMSMGFDGGATVEISQSKARVGSNTGTQPTVMGTTYRGAENARLTALDTLVGALAATIAALATAAPTFTNPSGVAAFNTAVAATATTATAYTGAVTTFNGGASSYLTTVAEVV